MLNVPVSAKYNCILSGAMNVLILQCCVCVCVCTLERVEIMLQFQTLGVVSDSKMNLVVALEESFFEIHNSFQKRREKPKKKMKEKREFLRKTSFRPNRFFYMVVSYELSSNVDKIFFGQSKYKILENLIQIAKS
ncbi:Uncharacterized protein FWK35_00018240 [Aphis craccivora]|uniref:Uncharacterized protein n=1 Tax=Aphis craccivora TaxID=307492 RepID=A0A6G0YHU4_APHCR|nr:Uncharacterized protein FWK35_00018240 [Aphis craccivora]